jgi:uncharacterized protein (TIGR03435 family)
MIVIDSHRKDSGRESRNESVRDWYLLNLVDYDDVQLRPARDQSQAEFLLHGGDEVRPLPIIVCAIAAVHAEDQPKFEEASVKRIDQGMIHNVLGPGTVILRGDPLRIILTLAFNMKTYQITGPAWLDEDCFEIVATMPSGASTDQIPAMLQVLLAERFKLAAHKEDRPRPVYALVVDRNGPKFKEANFKRFGLRAGQVMFNFNGTQGFKGPMTMAKVALFLSNKLDRSVQDSTGLQGTYDIDLSWSPPDDPSLDVFTAIKESLGLKLEPQTAPLQMLVIDRIERTPTAN